MSNTENERRLQAMREATPLVRKIRIDEMVDGAEGVVEASTAEREAIAALLDLLSLDSMTMSYRLRRRAGGRIGLAATVKASLGQTCVVTLEPVRSELNIPVEIEFWPEPLVEEFEASPPEPSHPAMLDWPEPIEDGAIDLGRVAYEALATGIDPYPKIEGASFGWTGDKVSAQAESAEHGPFAALEQLKRR